MKIWQFAIILLILWFLSCGKNELNNEVVPANDQPTEKVGYTVPIDSTIEPKISLVGNTKTISINSSEIISINPNFGEAGGLSIMQNYTTDHGLALDAVSAGYMDRIGNLWFGTNGGGVSCYNGKTFTNYTTSQGLPNNVVLCMLEDQNGNFWFGTDGGGISKYDGKSFINFTTEHGLAGDIVRSVMEDKNGIIWFGSDGEGVSRFNGNVVKNECTSNSCNHNLNNSEEKKIHNEVISTSFDNYSKKQGLANNVVLSIIEDKSGTIWFGTYGGGVSFHNATSLPDDTITFKTINTKDGLANDDVRAILQDKNGNIWFGTYGGGVSRYDGKSFVNFSVLDGLANDMVLTITEDKSGYIWFGTEGGGVTRYAPAKRDGVSTFTNFTIEQGLANDDVRTVVEDKTGNLWFGTSGGGLSRYDGEAVTNFTTAQGLANNAVLSIMEDHLGTLWFGTYGGGLSKYDGKSFTNFSSQSGLTNDVIFCIEEEKNGTLWFGTYGGGALRYDGKSFTNFTNENGLPNNIVWSIAEDDSGNIWLSTYSQGVSKYDGKTMTNYTTDQGLANNTVLSITVDSKGNIWFGTEGGGVSKYDGKTFTNFTTEHGLANNIVLSITEDKPGNIWFSTSGGGVSRYDGTSMINITTADGLPDDFVTQVVIDANDNIIIGTNFGLAVLRSFKPKIETEDEGIKIFAQNNLSSEELKNYTPVFEIYNSETGYPIKDVNAGQNAMFRDTRGIIWVATGADKTGLVRFDYAELNKNRNPLSVIIERIKINEENIAWYNHLNKFCDENNAEKIDSTTLAQQEVMCFGKMLTEKERDSANFKFGAIRFDSIQKFYPVPQNLILPYENNHITFEFAAIETSRPYLVKYRYMLEGYDRTWSPLTSKTEVSYGNIYEGSYTFKLRAQSPFGIWSEPITYEFKVLPPWWRTWWMYTAYIVFAILCITIIVWWNGRKLRARSVELKQKVEEATHEIKEQKHLIEEKHKEITDSINYAERIQRALLASKKLLDENLRDYYILFKPKDIVSGDFYWSTKLSNGNFVLATADSTGHGVPGAIMSILNIACLDKSVTQGIVSPDLILNETRRLVIEYLKNDGSAEGGKDGMDASLLSFDFRNNILFAACANNPVWIIRNNELIELKPDRRPIGKHEKDKLPFTLHSFDLQKGDVVYTLTDGYADQFGGESGKKFKYKKLQNLLLSMSHEQMNFQRQKLNDIFDKWKGDLEQVDDVCVIGVKI